MAIAGHIGAGKTTCAELIWEPFCGQSLFTPVFLSCLIHMDCRHPDRLKSLVVSDCGMGKSSVFAKVMLPEATYPVYRTRFDHLFRDGVLK